MDYLYRLRIRANFVTVVGAPLPWVAVGTMAVWLLIRRRRRGRRTASP